MLSNNLSFNVYSIAYPMDLPLNRIFELPAIVMSKPKIVVICFEDSWLSPHDGFLAEQQNQTNGYAEKRFLLASDKIKIEPYAKYLNTFENYVAQKKPQKFLEAMYGNRKNEGKDIYN